MSKIKNLLNKPITWGGLFKLSFVSAAICAVELLYIFDIPKRLVDKIKNLISDKPEQN